MRRLFRLAEMGCTFRGFWLTLATCSFVFKPGKNGVRVLVRTGVGKGAGELLIEGRQSLLVSLLGQVGVVGRGQVLII